MAMAIAKSVFPKVGLHVLGTDIAIHAFDAAFDERPKTFD